MIIFAYWVFQELRSVSAGDLGCFYQVGAYQLCDTTQRLSIYSSLFMLTVQALISRILVPGMSNFVNASVLSEDESSEISGTIGNEGEDVSNLDENQTISIL